MKIGDRVKIKDKGCKYDKCSAIIANEIVFANKEVFYDVEIIKERLGVLVGENHTCSVLCKANNLTLETKNAKRKNSKNTIQDN